VAEEVLTARIRADVTEAVEGFRQVQREANRLQISIKQIAVGFSGAVTAGIALYSNYARIRNAQMALVSANKELHETQITLAEYRKRLSEVTRRYGADSLETVLIMERIRAQEEMLTYKEMALRKAHEDLATAYLTTAATIIPNLITGMESLSNLYTTLKGLKGAVTVATAAETAAEVTKTTAVSGATAVQWLYNKALAVTHALSGPLGWAILGVAAAVTAATAIWLNAQRQQQAYNQTLDTTITQTEELIGLQAELGRMKPLERLHHEYVVVKRRYEMLMAERREALSRVERPVAVTIGRIEVSASSLGSPYDRDRAAEDLARRLAHKIALRVAG